MKKNGTLRVPQWLHDEWVQGDHLKLARQFQSCNFDKDPLYLNSWLPSFVEFARCQNKTVPSCPPVKLHHLYCFPGQDRFVKYRTNIHKKTETTRSDVDMGWYSKDDMVKVLKWNAKLPSNLLQLGQYHYCYILVVRINLINTSFLQWAP